MLLCYQQLKNGMLATWVMWVQKQFEQCYNNSSFTFGFSLLLVSWQLLSRAWRSGTLTLLLSLTSLHQIPM